MGREEELKMCVEKRTRINFIGKQAIAGVRFG